MEAFRRKEHIMSIIVPVSGSSIGGAVLRISAFKVLFGFSEFLLFCLKLNLNCGLFFCGLCYGLACTMAYLHIQYSKAADDISFLEDFLWSYIKHSDKSHESAYLALHLAVY
ncbi:hypothetical protein CEXT_289181 [Caerostris extrusa]|uniref:Uncharacterized protein n=1 Tax=Caerostris extrusa TaxID=172846 RepID=A0AAV4RNZ1_CAEEX|nr:hypothetical protein CEXT_289181 [Caerostris extrusa]